MYEVKEKNCKLWSNSQENFIKFHNYLTEEESSLLLLKITGKLLVQQEDKHFYEINYTSIVKQTISKSAVHLRGKEYFPYHVIAERATVARVEFVKGGAAI